ncbi:MAG: DUF1592 domain-containing protein, partial [Verrucomicrobiota bacterium]
GMDISYEDHVLPILENYCYDCHGDGSAKGDIALDKHESMAAMMKDKSMWQKVLHNVEVEVMPPAKRKDQPTPEEVEILLSWISGEVFKIDCENPDPGRVTIRRLNRFEYANSIRDLTGVTINPKEELLPDDTGYGFDNIGDVLSLSPILFEKYLKLADEILDQALRTEPPVIPSVRIESNEMEGGENYGEDQVLMTNSALAFDHKIPKSGAYVIEVEASASRAGDDLAAMAVRIDEQKAAVTFEVENPRNNPGLFRHEVRLKAGTRKIEIAFINDFYDANAEDPERTDRNLYVRSATITGPLYAGPSSLPKFQRELFARHTAEYAKPQSRTLKASQLKGGVVEDGWWKLLASRDSVKAEVEVPADDRYLVRVVAAQRKAGSEDARMRLLVDRQVIGTQSVGAGMKSPKEFVFETKLKGGKQELSLYFENDYFKSETEDRNLYIRSLTLERLATPAQGNLLPKSAHRELARKMIRDFGLKAFRRPLRDNELDALADGIFASGASYENDYAFERGIHAAFSALLTSPSFLFRGETQPDPNSPKGNHLIDEWSLATRLSYFLWSSTPDEALLQHAANGTLRKNLRSEVDRMLKDSRANSLVTNFASQWLQVRDVINVERSRRFTGFNRGIAEAMQRESEALIRHIIREDLPVTELLTADYTFLNERLARFYDIEGVEGSDFQYVALDGRRQSGILGHGSVLTLTSNPTRTSPVKRGKWILENILGTPPPEAPPDVPNLDESREKASGGSLREQLEIHRDDPNCSACHALMDPIGFAFENYNAVGQWRDMDEGEPIDASGQLVTGEKFQNSTDLSRILIANRQDQFLRCMSERMLTYGLGRGVEFYDKCALDKIVQQLNEGDKSFSTMIHAVVNSVPFQYRRGEGERSYD